MEMIPGLKITFLLEKDLFSAFMDMAGEKILKLFGTSFD